MKKNILVTGAAGFIGFHFAQYCISKENSVVGIDNFNDYYPIALKRKRAALLQERGVSVLSVDITDTEAVRSLISREGITHVVHLAAQAGVRLSLTEPHKYIHANVTGFLSLLEALRPFSNIPLVYASSSSVYGHNSKIPFSVLDPTDSPANIYGVSKKNNELMAFVYHKLYRIPMTGLRFFTVYGPWGRPDMAYFSFTQSIVEGKEIQVYNDGNMARDFTYIDDIVKGIAAATERTEGCDIYNLGNRRPEKLMTLIELIEKYTGKKAKIRFMPIQPGEIETTYADIEISRRELGFVPATTLAEGMRRFVDWYTQVRE